MKSALIVIILLSCIVTSPLFAQERNPCDKPYSIVGSMMMGGSSHGPVETLELGLWGKKNGLGLSTGVMIYSGKAIINKETKTSEIPLVTELYIRPTLKLDHNEIIGFHHAITMFIGDKGNYGASYRVYYQCGRSIMLGLEPYVSKMNGEGLNFIVTFAF